MPGELLQGLERALRRYDLHEFHLVELVLAQHAAHVAPVGPCLAAKAGRVRAQLERHLFGLEDAVAHVVGQWNLGGRDEVVALLRHVEQVLGELGELARAAHRVAVHKVTSVNLTTLFVLNLHNVQRVSFITN